MHKIRSNCAFSGAAQSAHRKAARPASPRVAAFAAARLAAAGDRSIPIPKAAGNSCSAASSRHPLPVPRSRIRFGGEREAKAARAASIRVSDSAAG